MTEIKILITDDHQIIVDGLKSLVNSLKGCEVVAVANNGREAIDILKILSVDIILMDIDMPVLNGLDATRIIKAKYKGVKILILSMHSQQGMIKNLMEIGVDGYLLKNSCKTELENAIKQVASGGQYFSPGVTHSLMAKNVNTEITGGVELTKREIEILQYIADGFSNKEIGEKLFISHRTVDTHRTNLMKKLEVKNIAGLISYAIKNGIVQ